MKQKIIYAKPNKAMAGARLYEDYIRSEEDIQIGGMKIHIVHMYETLWISCSESNYVIYAPSRKELIYIWTERAVEERYNVTEHQLRQEFREQSTDEKIILEDITKMSKERNITKKQLPMDLYREQSLLEWIKDYERDIRSHNKHIMCYEEEVFHHKKTIADVFHNKEKISRLVAKDYLEYLSHRELSIVRQKLHYEELDKIQKHFR